MKLRKTLKSKKGFTLVEIVVVLVIIAILAAASVPAMIGFVNQARGQEYIANARTMMVAAQATATRLHSANITITRDSIASSTDFQQMIIDIPGGTTAFRFIQTGGVDNARITGIIYTYDTWSVRIVGGNAVARRNNIFTDFTS